MASNDYTAEIDLQTAVNLLPAFGGRQPSIKTIKRWIHSGVNGVRLAAWRYGRRLVTTREAIEQFKQDCSAAMRPVTPEIATIQATERSRRAARAYLNRKGLTVGNETEIKAGREQLSGVYSRGSESASQDTGALPATLRAVCASEESGQDNRCPSDQEQLGSSEAKGRTKTKDRLGLTPAARTTHRKRSERKTARIFDGATTP